MIKTLLIPFVYSTLTVSCFAEEPVDSPNLKVYQKMDERTQKLRISEVNFENATMNQMLTVIYNEIAGDKQSHDGLQVTSSKPIGVDPEYRKLTFSYTKKNASILEILEAFKKQTGIGYDVLQCVVFWKIDPQEANANKEPLFKIDKKFSTIIIPRIDYDNTTWYHAIARLTSVVRDNDNERNGAKKGIECIFTPQLIEDLKKVEIKLTYKMRGATFLEALEAYKKHTNICYTIRPCIVLNSYDPTILDKALEEAP